MAKEKKITSADLLGLLENRHHADIFVPECKNGPTHSASHIRMDAWCMRHSWTNPQITGYEIKISRSDFMEDDKWRGYLKYCHDFYFVAPPGIIDPAELPPEAGLLVCSKNCKMLYKKKKSAGTGTDDIPHTLWMYLLICRSVITGESQGAKIPRADKAKYWKEWLEEEEGFNSVGWKVSKRLREQYREMEDQRNMARNNLEALGPLLERVKELGLNPEERISTWDVKSALDEFMGSVPRSLKRDISRVRDGLDNLLGDLENG